MKKSGFPSVLTFICLFSALISSCYAECKQQHMHMKASVSKVYDGDTLQLTDGTRIRIIGMNAPEFGRRGQADELFAEQAKSLLVSLLNKHNNQVSLQYGPDRLDRYGRTLAHVFLDDGTNIAEHLLISGLASKGGLPTQSLGAGLLPT